MGSSSQFLDLPARGPVASIGTLSYGRLVRAFLAATFTSLCALAATARADGISGIITDVITGAPVLDATVVVTGGKLPKPLSAKTDGSGYFAVDVSPGTYGVVISFGAERSVHDAVVVAAGKPTRLDDLLDVTGNVEVTTIRERAPVPAVPARPSYASESTVLPYTSEAIVTDQWAVAWLLLDIDERGRVVSFRFLHRPGHGLDAIARRRAFELSFTPARDANGAPVASQRLWKMEWPSYWRSIMLGGAGTTQGSGDKVPCRGSAPLNLASVAPTYRDCSPPDYKAARTAELILPSSSDAVTAGNAEKARADLDVEDCARGVPDACFDLAIRLDEGRSFPRDRKRARELVERACTLGKCRRLRELRRPLRRRPRAA